MSLPVPHERALRAVELLTCAEPAVVFIECGSEVVRRRFEAAFAARHPERDLRVVTVAANSQLPWDELLEGAEGGVTSLSFEWPSLDDALASLNFGRELRARSRRSLLLWGGGRGAFARFVLHVPDVWSHRAAVLVLPSREETDPAETCEHTVDEELSEIAVHAADSRFFAWGTYLPHASIAYRLLIAGCYARCVAANHAAREVFASATPAQRAYAFATENALRRSFALEVGRLDAVIDEYPWRDAPLPHDGPHALSAEVLEAFRRRGMAADAVRIAAGASPGLPRHERLNIRLAACRASFDLGAFARVGAELYALSKEFDGPTHPPINLPDCNLALQLRELRARAALDQADPAAAAALALGVCDAAARVGMHAVAASSAMVSVRALCALGLLDDAVATFAHTSCERVDWQDPLELSRALATLARAGRLTQVEAIARARMKRWQDTAREVRDADFTRQVALGVARVELLLGEHDAARSALARVFDGGDDDALADAATALAVPLARQRDPQEAVAACERWHAHASARHAWNSAAHALVEHARIDGIRGDVHRALQRLEEATSAVDAVDEALRSNRTRASILCARPPLLARIGRQREAGEAALHACRWMEEVGLFTRRIYGLTELAMSSWFDGDARSLATEALDRARDAQMPAAEARAMVALAALPDTPTHEARALSEEARWMLRELYRADDA